MATQLVPADQATPIDFDYSAIERAPKLQPSTKAQYKKAIKLMVAAGVNPSDYKGLQAYADTLKSSGKQFLKSALRLATLDFEQELKASARPETIGMTQAAVYRLDAMRGAVQVPTHKGTKAHTWLSSGEVTRITALCGQDLTGRRDWIVLGLLLGAGLRREELAGLKFDSMKSQPTKKGSRWVLAVKGKGAKDRVIPISDLLAERLQEWQRIAGGEYIARRVYGKINKRIGEGLSAVAIFQLVSSYGAKIGKPGLAPHDLRRTYAQLGYNAGVPITQISKLLGHSSVSTTQRYLNLDLDLETTASDFIPLAG